MPVPQIVADGTQLYGSPTITINGQAYKTNSFAVTRAVSEANDRLTNGAPGRARYTKGVDTVAMEVQLTPGIPFPKFGDTFTLTIDANYGSEAWIIMPLDQNLNNSDTEIRVGTFNARKAINPSDITVVN